MSLKTPQTTVAKTEALTHAIGHGSQNGYRSRIATHANLTTVEIHHRGKLMG
jgi:hypothetical protein